MCAFRSTESVQIPATAWRRVTNQVKTGWNLLGIRIQTVAFQLVNENRLTTVTTLKQLAGLAISCIQLCVIHTNGTYRKMWQQICNRRCEIHHTYDTCGLGPECVVLEKLYWNHCVLLLDSQFQSNTTYPSKYTFYI